MLKSADLHESILTPVICHKHLRYHDDRKWIFFLYVSRLPLSEVKKKQKQKQKKEENLN